ncbi:hypothetical protein GCK32_022809, partial [Trichostrongylus colubriformis]
ESKEESEATSGADQEVPSDAEYQSHFYERTSPLLEEDEKPVMATSFYETEQKESMHEEPSLRPPSPSWESEEPTVSAARVPEVPSEPILTQEELDHIAYIQRLAEESSFAAVPPPRPAPPSVEELRKYSITREDTDIPRYADQLEREESKESEATSGADQEVLSDAEYQSQFYERTSPLLEEDEKPDIATSFYETEQKESMHEEPSLRPPSPSWESEEPTVSAARVPEVPSEPILTQEELDHIAYIQRLAEESSFAAVPPPRPAPPSVEELRKYSITREDTDIPRYADQLEREESKESEATSGADQEVLSDAEYQSQFYERTSPLLEEDEKPDIATSFYETEQKESMHEEPSLRPPSPSWESEEPTASAARVPEVPSEPMLTQGELDHIAYIQRLAEESSFAAVPPPRPAPPSVEELRKYSITREDTDIPRYADQLEREESKENSEVTSGVDDDAPSEEKYVARTSHGDREGREIVHEGLLHRSPSPLWEAAVSTETAAELLDERVKQALTSSKENPERSFTQADEKTHSPSMGELETNVAREHSLLLSNNRYSIQPSSDFASPQDIEKRTALPDADTTVQHILSGNSFVEADIPENEPAKLTPTVESPAAPIAENGFTPTRSLNPQVPAVMEAGVPESAFREEDMTSDLNSMQHVSDEKFQFLDEQYDISSMFPKMSERGNGPPHVASNKYNRTVSNASQYPSGSSERTNTGGSRRDNEQRNSAIDGDSQGSGEISQGSSQSLRGESQQLYDSSQFMDRSDQRTDESRRARFQRRYTATSGLGNTEKRDGLSRSTSINYTSNVARQSSFISGGRNVANNPFEVDGNPSTRQEPAISQRGSNVRVIYTDHSLRESQSSHPESPSSSIREDVTLAEPSEDGSLQYISRPWPEIGVTVDTIDSPSGRNLRRSLSELGHEGPDSQAAESIRFSLSSSCVANICSEQHAFLNAY